MSYLTQELECWETLPWTLAALRTSRGSLVLQPTWLSAEGIMLCAEAAFSSGNGRTSTLRPAAYDLVADLCRAPHPAAGCGRDVPRPAPRDHRERGEPLCVGVPLLAQAVFNAPADLGKQRTIDSWFSASFHPFVQRHARKFLVFRAMLLLAAVIGIRCSS